MFCSSRCSKKPWTIFCASPANSHDDGGMWRAVASKLRKKWRASFLGAACPNRPPCLQEDSPMRRLASRTAFLQRSWNGFRRKFQYTREVRVARQNEMPLSANSMFLASASCAVILKRCGASAFALLRSGGRDGKRLARGIETSRLPTGAQPPDPRIPRMKLDSVYSNALRSPSA